MFVVLGAAMQAAFQSGSGKKIILRAIMYVMFLLGAVAVLWAFTQRYLPRSVASDERVSQTDALVAQLANKEWALDGESCERDAIHFVSQGGELVGYPKRASAFHYRILNSNGQRLAAEYHQRLVIFQIEPNGFTYIDGGSEQWYRLCGLPR